MIFIYSLNLSICTGQHNSYYTIISKTSLRSIMSYCIIPAPGKAFSMEKAPFKLTEEMVEVMGGPNSPYFEEFCKLCTKAFLVAREHAYSVIQLMEVMSFQSNYPAFRYVSICVNVYVSLFVFMSENVRLRVIDVSEHMFCF